MNDFIVMRSFLNRREPFVEKVRRDGERMHDEARYVIILNKEGNIEGEIDRSEGSTGNYIVVLAPVNYKNHTIDRSVVLEIGLGRSVPYNQFRTGPSNTSDAITYRCPVAKLADEKVIDLLPKLGQVIQSVVDEDISHRRNLIYYTSMTPFGDLSKIGKEVPNGKFITIPNEESILVYSCLSKDIELRSKTHLSLFVKIIKRSLGNLKHAYYPKGELKRFKVVKEIASVLKESNYPIHFIEIIRAKLGKETTKVRALFEQILEVFGIEPEESSDEKYLLYKSLHKIWKERQKELMNRLAIKTISDSKRDVRKKQYAKTSGNNQTHAQNCIRVEVYPSEEAIEKINPRMPDGTRQINLSTTFIDRVHGASSQ